MEFTIPRFFKPPSDSYFLFGPRSVGKTTFLKQNYSNALWIDLLLPDTFRTFSAKPERLIEMVLGNPHKKTIIVDEVQKVPEILNAVHSLVEDKKNLQFILTGSSARKLKKSSTDLLAGRLLLKRMYPFIISELAEIPDLSHILKYGLLPIVTFSEHPGEVLDAYINLYIREEVQMEGMVRNIGNFSRFLEAISFSHASMLNISNVARECEVERKVVENYISILEDILLAYRLPVFSKKAKRNLAKHPKFYFFDAGVFYTLRPKGPLDRPQEINGAALEGLVLQHLKAWNDYKNRPFNIYFWRSKGGLEVDFILYGKDGIFAIEVKNSTHIHKNDIKSLTEFKKDYPAAQMLLLYRGKENIRIRDVFCMPCKSFLKRLSPVNGIQDIIYQPLSSHES